MLGGRLMALTLWNSYCNYQKLKPSDYESGNPIVIAIGAASDLAHPLLDGYVLAPRSPVTGSLSVTAGEGRIAKALVWGGDLRHGDPGETEPHHPPCHHGS